MSDTKTTEKTTTEESRQQRRGSSIASREKRHDHAGRLIVIRSTFAYSRAARRRNISVRFILLSSLLAVVQRTLGGQETTAATTREQATMTTPLTPTLERSEAEAGGSIGGSFVGVSPYSREIDSYLPANEAEDRITKVKVADERTFRRDKESSSFGCYYCFDYWNELASNSSSSSSNGQSDGGGNGEQSPPPETEDETRRRFLFSLCDAPMIDECANCGGMDDKVDDECACQHCACSDAPAASRSTVVSRHLSRRRRRFTSTEATEEDKTSLNNDTMAKQVQMPRGRPPERRQSDEMLQQRHRTAAGNPIPAVQSAPVRSTHVSDTFKRQLPAPPVVLSKVQQEMRSDLVVSSSIMTTIDSASRGRSKSWRRVNGEERKRTGRRVSGLAQSLMERDASERFDQTASNEQQQEQQRNSSVRQAKLSSSEEEHEFERARARLSECANGARSQAGLSALGAAAENVRQRCSLRSFSERCRCYCCLCSRSQRAVVVVVVVRALALSDNNNRQWQWERRRRRDQRSTIEMHGRSKGGAAAARRLDLRAHSTLRSDLCAAVAAKPNGSVTRLLAQRRRRRLCCQESLNLLRCDSSVCCSSCFVRGQTINCEVVRAVVKQGLGQLTCYFTFSSTAAAAAAVQVAEDSRGRVHRVSKNSRADKSESSQEGKAKSLPFDLKRDDGLKVEKHRREKRHATSSSSSISADLHRRRRQIVSSESKVSQNNSTSSALSFQRKHYNNNEATTTTSNHRLEDDDELASELLELRSQFYAYTRRAQDKFEDYKRKFLATASANANATSRPILKSIENEEDREAKEKIDPNRPEVEDSKKEKEPEVEKSTNYKEQNLPGAAVELTASARRLLEMLAGVDEENLARFISASQDKFSRLKNLSIDIIYDRPNSSINVCPDGPKILLLMPNASDYFYCYTRDQWHARLWSDWLRLSSFHYPIILLNILIFLIGTTGNIFVCLSVNRNHQLRSVTNYFIVNLAFADFLVILICLPATVVWDLSLTWFFGTIPCKLIMFLQDVSISVSVLTLAAISIDRYYAICHPLKFKTSLNQAKHMIALIWLVSLVIMAPDLVYLSAKPSADLAEAGLDTVLYNDCNYDWSADASRAFQFVKTVLLYLVPLLLMFCAHYRIQQVLGLASSMMAMSSSASVTFAAAAHPNGNLAAGQTGTELDTMVEGVAASPSSSPSSPPPPVLAVIQQTIKEESVGVTPSATTSIAEVEPQIVQPQAQTTTQENKQQRTSHNHHHHHHHHKCHKHQHPNGGSTCKKVDHHHHHHQRHKRSHKHKKHKKSTNHLKCHPHSQVSTSGTPTSSSPEAITSSQVVQVVGVAPSDQVGVSVSIASPATTKKFGFIKCNLTNSSEKQKSKSYAKKQRIIADLLLKRECSFDCEPPKLPTSTSCASASTNEPPPASAAAPGGVQITSNSNSTSNGTTNKQTRKPPLQERSLSLTSILTPRGAAAALAASARQRQPVQLNGAGERKQVQLAPTRVGLFAGNSSAAATARQRATSTSVFAHCDSANSSTNAFILTMHNESKLESRRKAAKMLTAIVILFGICYLPVHLINFLRQFIDDIPQTDATSTISMLAHCVCYLNSAINPIIYNHMNSVFRAEFKKFLSCLDWRKTRTPLPPPPTSKKQPELSRQSIHHLATPAAYRQTNHNQHSNHTSRRSTLVNSSLLTGTSKQVAAQLTPELCKLGAVQPVDTTQAQAQAAITNSESPSEFLLSQSLPQVRS